LAHDSFYYKKDIRKAINSLVTGRFIYYNVIHSITMEQVCIRLEGNFLTALEKIMRKNRYSTKTEFIREAIREKMRKLEEREILENKDLLVQILASEKNIKKRKIKELKY